MTKHLPLIFIKTRPVIIELGMLKIIGILEPICRANWKKVLLESYRFKISRYKLIKTWTIADTSHSEYKEIWPML